MQAEGTRFRAGVDVGARPHRRRAARAVRRRRARRRRHRAARPAGARAASSPASTRRWSSCRRPTGSRSATSVDGPDHAPTGKHVVDHRRRRHRRRLPRHRAPPGRRARSRSWRSCRSPPDERPAQPAVADLPDDLPGLLGARGGRRPGLRRVDPASSSATSTGRVRGAAAASRSSCGDGRFEEVEGTEREIPARPRAARDGLHRPGAGRRCSSSSASSSTSAATSPATTTTRPSVAGRLRRRRRRSRPVAHRLGDRRGPFRRAAVDAWLIGQPSRLPRPINPTDRPLAAPEQARRRSAVRTVTRVTVEALAPIGSTSCVEPRSSAPSARPRRSPEQIRALVEAGMDVARLNLSHGDYADHEAVYRDVRAGQPTRPAAAVGILVDLQGPKIRLGTVRRRAGRARATAHDVHHHHRATSPGDARTVSARRTRACPATSPPATAILIDDGKVAPEVIAVDGDRRRQPGGRGRHGLATTRASTCPASRCRVPAMSEKDERRPALGAAAAAST